MKTAAWTGLAAFAMLAGVASATAQTRPHHSGHMSFNAPQMHPERSGFHRPNRPSHHHFYGHPGYRPVHRHHL
jgi:hypothetical protein